MVSIGTPVTGWQENILDTARQFMNGEVCFYRVVGGTDHLPEIGQVGTPATVEVLWKGKARIQHLRAPRRDSTEYQASDSRSFRFQLDPLDEPPVVYAGTKARVTNGGRDASLETYSYQVESAVNSSHMAVRTVELTADMRPHTWGWDPVWPISG